MSRTAISILGGLGAMLGWGTSDFFANSASDKVGHTKAFFWSQLAGIGLVLSFFTLFGNVTSFDTRMSLIIILTGISYTLGYLYFYNGFEIGNVSVVSAVINLQTLFIIAIAYFIYGQTPTIYQIPAIIFLITGVTLVSVNFKELRSGDVSLAKGVKETVIAALFFGLLFWPLNEYIVERVDWLYATLLIKVIAIATVYVITLYSRQSLKVKDANTKLWLVLAIVGILEAAAVISMSYGVSYGDGIIVAPIASALTVVTVSLAMIFLKEKITRIQGIGIVMTIFGIILTSF